jgi:hypothetical protein
MSLKMSLGRSCPYPAIAHRQQFVIWFAQVARDPRKFIANQFRT